LDKDLIYLAQTDTTVGFLSNDNVKLANIKNRSTTQKTLRVVDSFKTLNTHTRIPKNQRKLVRNSKNTTFIYPNGESFRVVPINSSHHKFIKKFGTLYSTSANDTNKEFTLEFALNAATIQLLNKNDFVQSYSSSILKIMKNKNIQIR